MSLERSQLTIVRQHETAYRAFRLIEHSQSGRDHDLYRTPLRLVDEGIVGDFARGAGRLGADALRGTGRLVGGAAKDVGVSAAKGTGRLVGKGIEGAGKAGMGLAKWAGKGLARGATELGRGLVGAKNKEGAPQTGMHRAGELAREKLGQWRQRRAAARATPAAGDQQTPPSQPGVGTGEQPPAGQAGQAGQPAQPTQPAGSRLGRMVGAARRGAQWLAGRTPEQRQQARTARQAAHQALSDFEAEHGPEAAQDPKHADEIQRRMALGVARATGGKVIPTGRKLRKMHKEIESSPRTVGRRERAAREKEDAEGFKKADEKVAAQLGHEKWERDYLAGRTPEQLKKRAGLEKQGREKLAGAPADPLAQPEGGGPSKAQQERQKELQARRTVQRLRGVARKVKGASVIKDKAAPAGDFAASMGKASDETKAELERQAAEKEAATQQQHAAARAASAASPRGQKKAARRSAERIERSKRSFKTLGGKLPGEGEPSGKELVTPGGAKLTGDRPQVEVPEPKEPEPKKLILPGQPETSGSSKELVSPGGGKLKLKPSSPVAQAGEKPSVKGPATGPPGGGAQGGQEGPGRPREPGTVPAEGGKCPEGYYQRSGATDHSPASCAPKGESLERSGRLRILRRYHLLSA